MEQYNLSDYLNLSTNEVLKIKLKNEKEYLFGWITSADMLTKPTETPLNNGIFSEFKKIIHFEKYIHNNSHYEDFSYTSIESSQIESIEIIKPFG